MRFFLAVLISLFSVAALAQSVPPPALAAKAWVLVDHATGQTLVCLPPKGKPAVRPIAFRVWSRILKQPF